MIQTFSQPQKWMPAVILRKLGNYRIKLNGGAKEVHGAHLKSRIEKKVTFNVTDFDLKKGKRDESEDEVFEDCEAEEDGEQREKLKGNRRQSLVKSESEVFEDCEGDEDIEEKGRPKRIRTQVRPYVAPDFRIKVKRY